MKKLQEKIDGMNVADFINFYNGFKGYKSECREVIKNEYIDKTFTYSVRFTYIMVDESWLYKGDTATKIIIDPIWFNTIEDTELYIKTVGTPIKHHNSNDKNRFYLELKDNDLIFKYTGCKPEWLIGKHGVPIFGLYGTYDYDRPTFEEFIYTIKVKNKQAFKTTTTISSYEIKDLVNIKLNDDIKKLTECRNSVIVNEIKRTEQYLKFLKSLLK